MRTTFGAALKSWRGQRRLSQLDLGLAANVSARHISFLETGRAKPSRTMVTLLCESLEVPQEARNGLLDAAGFAPAYRRRDLDDADMAAVRDAVAWTLERHDPFPAFALDRHWRVVKANAAAGRLLGAVGLREGDSLLEALADEAKLPAVLDNWQEVQHHTLVRLRTENAYLGGDPLLEAAIVKLTAALGPRPQAPEGLLPAIVPTRYRAGGTLLSLFSTIAQFGTAEDIALAELKIELLFPADAATRATLQVMAAQG
ncbi:MAG: helix-turn-helix transcriptional regulator [Rhodospirillales bacterium]